MYLEFLEVKNAYIKASRRAFAEHHHGDAGRHGQRLLRAGEHHVGAPTLHTDVVGQKCTDGIHHQYQTVFTAESGDHVHIVQNAGGRLVHIHQKARVALSGIGGQIGGGLLLH